MLPEIAVQIGVCCAGSRSGARRREGAGRSAVAQVIELWQCRGNLVQRSLLLGDLLDMGPVGDPEN